MNTTLNGSSSWSCSSLINPEALKVGATRVALSLILVVSLVGNSLIVLGTCQKLAGVGGGGGGGNRGRVTTF